MADILDLTENRTFAMCGMYGDFQLWTRIIQTNSFNVRNLLLEFCPTSTNISFTRRYEIRFLLLLNGVETGRYVELSVTKCRSTILQSYIIPGKHR